MKCEYYGDEIGERQDRITLWTTGYQYHFCSFYCFAEFSATFKGMKVIPDRSDNDE